MTDFENNGNMIELDLADLESVSGGKKSSDQKIKATGDLNVRTGPGLDYAIIGSIKKGSTLEFLGEVKKDGRGVYWGKVRYSGRDGWVSSKYAKLI